MNIVLVSPLENKILVLLEAQHDEKIKLTVGDLLEELQAINPGQVNEQQLRQTLSAMEKKEWVKLTRTFVELMPSYVNQPLQRVVDHGQGGVNLSADGINRRSRPKSEPKQALSAEWLESEPLQLSRFELEIVSSLHGRRKKTTISSICQDLSLLSGRYFNTEIILETLASLAMRGVLLVDDKSVVLLQSNAQQCKPITRRLKQIKEVRNRVTRRS